MYVWIFIFPFQCAENLELQEKLNQLERRIASLSGEKSSGFSEHSVSEEYVDELRKKIQSQVVTVLS